MYKGFYQGCGAGVGFFCSTPTPEVQLDHFLHHTRKLGIPVEMVHFVLKLVVKQISSFAPQFPLLANFYKIVNSQSLFRLC